jgi:hypothetical protein
LFDQETCPLRSPPCFRRSIPLDVEERRYQ